MDRFLFLLLLVGFGFGTSSVQADPASPSTSKKTNKSTGKVIAHPLKSRKLDPHTVGDFGALPTNSYKPKNHNDGTVPPHPSDFGAVEWGSDIRKAK